MTRYMTKQYGFLNAIRGVAALCVVLFHASVILKHSLLPHGYLAVDLFFLLSGFVVAHAYDDRLRGGLTAIRFVGLRVLRFYPLYLCGLALGLLYQLILLAIHANHAQHPALIASSLALSLFYIPLPSASVDESIFLLNPPSWSLFYELLVNIAFAALHRFLDRSRLIWAVGLSGLTLGIYIIATRNPGPGPRATDLFPWMGLARTAFSFFLGVFLHRARLVLKLPPALLVAILVAFFAAPATLSPWVDMVFIAFVSPLLVIAGSSCGPATVRTERLFEVLGAISFPLYAVHMPVLLLADAAARALHAPTWTFGIAALVSLVPASLLLDRLYDVPVRRRLGAIVARATGQRPTGTQGDTSADGLIASPHAPAR